MDQNTYLSTVPPYPCPVCSAPSDERGWQSFISGYTHISSEKHPLQGSAMSPLVCYRCGFVQLFVNPQDFHKEPS